MTRRRFSAFLTSGPRGCVTYSADIFYTRLGVHSRPLGLGPFGAGVGKAARQPGSKAARQRGSEAEGSKAARQRGRRQQGSEAARQRGSQAEGSKAARQRGSEAEGEMRGRGEPYGISDWRFEISEGGEGNCRLQIAEGGVWVCLAKASLQRSAVSCQPEGIGARDVCPIPS
jgi:hypothetical protein